MSGLTMGTNANRKDSTSTDEESKAPLRTISVCIPQALKDGLENLVALGVFANRSEAIRVAVRDLINSTLNMLQFIRKSNKRSSNHKLIAELMEAVKSMKEWQSIDE